LNTGSTKSASKYSSFDAVAAVQRSVQKATNAAATALKQHAKYEVGWAKLNGVNSYKYGGTNSYPYCKLRKHWEAVK